MTTPISRGERLQRLREGRWDVIIIGGGISGAGIALEAAHAGARVALIEAGDFASGTSSRSSKLVHGGLRYLKQGRLGLTRESVRERSALLRAAPGLVEPLPFLLPFYPDSPSGPALVGVGLALYDGLAGRRSRRWLDADALRWQAPEIASAGLRGGWHYLDAQTDDARLTLRVIAEAEAAGALCLNYVRADALLRDGERAPVRGLRLQPEAAPAFELAAGCVINATGWQADRLRGDLGLAPLLRPLRGSHLLFPAWRLPVSQAIALFHPQDRRPVYAIPWEGATLVGTTDLDHRAAPEQAPAISGEEAAYLLQALNTQFPSLDLRLEEALCSWSGVRPVVSSGSHTAPSDENREHLIIEESGLITVSGGKLTTFRSTALAVLQRLRRQLPGLTPRRADAIIFASAPERLPPLLAALDPWRRQRLSGRLGAAVTALADADPAELAVLPATTTSCAELRHACRFEQVQHLDDLLLRRSRYGLTRTGGGIESLAELRSLVAAELGWDGERWRSEVERYCAIWSSQHAVQPP